VPPAPAAPRFVGVERGRPLPSIERALSGPGSRGDASNWHRQVKVVAGGQGPGKRDQETLDRDRARLPLAAPSLIAVLGCTRGAGQTVTALMTGHILATLRGVPVATLDLNPGPTSLAARRAPAAAVQDLLAGREPRPEHRPELRAGPAQGARLDVIASMPGPSMAGHNMPGHGMAGHGLPGHGALEGADFGRLADLMTERYSLTMIDPSPAGLTRVLAVADLLVLVAPASPDAATSLANTQQWLSAHGHGELAARAVTVVNGVSRRTKEDVLRAESVARGRCRAIVRVPWDDSLAVRPSRPSAGYPQVTAYPQVTLQPQARLAYTALAGVLAAALSASPASPVPGRNAGEHSD
jgi:MinD-like ATPase involved in chromosome partitioning or flagellar assembly